MSCWTSRRRSPSTLNVASMWLRMRATSSSVRSRTRVSGSMSRAEQISCGAGAPDAEDVGERDLQPLLAGDVDAGDACHVCLSTPLALALLVAGVGADDLHAPVAADHLALLTDSLDARTNLHGFPSLCRVWGWAPLRPMQPSGARGPAASTRRGPTRPLRVIVDRSADDDGGTTDSAESRLSMLARPARRENFTARSARAQPALTPGRHLPTDLHRAVGGPRITR